MSEIPNRLWYAKSEAALLHSTSVATINRLIREGKRAHPTERAILPEHTREFLGRTQISAAWVLGTVPNLTPLPAPVLSKEQIKEAVRELFREAFVEAEPRPLRKVS